MKFVARTYVGKLYVLGLSAENLRRLPSQPILFAGEQLGLPGTQFVIFVGESDEKMLADLREQVAETGGFEFGPEETETRFDVLVPKKWSES